MHSSRMPKKPACARISQHALRRGHVMPPGGVMLLGECQMTPRASNDDHRCQWGCIAKLIAMGQTPPCGQTDTW